MVKCKVKSDKFAEGKTSVLAMVPLQLMIQFMCFFDEFGINNALPKVQEQQKISPNAAQWLNTLYYIGIATLSIPSGKIADMVGNVNVLIVVLVILCINNILAFFFNTFAVLLVLRLISGLCTAFVVTIRNGIVSKYVRPEQAQMSVQVYQTYQLVAKAITPLCIGYIIELADWPPLFLISSGFSFISLLFLIPYQNCKVIKQNKKFDFWGIVLLAITVVSFCSAFTFVQSEQYWIMVGLFVLSVIGLLAFIKVELIHQDPIMPMYIMKVPVLNEFIQNTIANCVTIGATWIFPQIVNKPVTVGYVQMSQNFIGVLSGLLLLYLQKKLVYRYILIIFNALTALSFFTIIFTIQNKAALIAMYIVSLTFYVVCAQALFTMLLISVSNKYKQKVSALPPTSRGIGSSFSLCLFSNFVQIAKKQYMKKHPEKSEEYSFSQGAKVAFIIMIILNVISILDCALLVGNTSSERGKKGFNEKNIREIVEKVDEEEIRSEIIEETSLIKQNEEEFEKDEKEEK